ncbi:PREDICTED: regulator of microtubule dynamics protein 1-like isoform X2 [Dinoponera quadriceps]|nr:PREDICTED: regulator of microtubule dynamics protein 1-like isoform X2 [Dinoponera quadriceps]XP_014469411.1 PREDICTED: regulator of microtubule dynamics protein 1-like isoform X2 [Dinoponera quadriceps]XP_014469412.1 PREDICTED: regulator of microtubule dynamics protein 1-like isoform X2 [Dinoponera quadriceps]
MLRQRLFHVAKYSRILQRVLCKNNHAGYKVNDIRVVRKLTWAASPFISMGIWGFMKNTKGEENNVETQIIDRKILLHKADALFDQGNYKEIYDILLNHKDSKDVEILWRLSRAIYKISKTASDVEARKLIYEGYDLIHTALGLEKDHFAVHKWMAIFLDSKGTLEGTKAHIKELQNIKRHLLRATELNPADATTFYILGCWCYEISNLTWYQRKIASVIFGEPPFSSFEEALTYFEQAEKADPNFYSHNLLMLGKTYLKLQRNEDAVKYLQKVIAFPAKNDDDQKAKQEAQKILSDISLK